MQETATHPIAIVDGEAVFAGSDVPLRELLRHWECGYTLSEFVAKHPQLSRERVVQAVRRMERLLKDSAVEVDDAFLKVLRDAAEQGRRLHDNAIRAWMATRDGVDGDIVRAEESVAVAAEAA